MESKPHLIILLLLLALPSTPESSYADSAIQKQHDQEIIKCRKNRSAVGIIGTFFSGIFVDKTTRKECQKEALEKVQNHISALWLNNKESDQEFRMLLQSYHNLYQPDPKIIKEMQVSQESVTKESQSSLKELLVNQEPIKTVNGYVTTSQNSK